MIGDETQSNNENSTFTSADTNSTPVETPEATTVETSTENVANTMDTASEVEPTTTEPAVSSMPVEPTFISQNPTPEPMTSMGTNDIGTTKKSSKLKWIIIALVVIIVLAIGGFIGYRTYTNSPHNLFKAALNKGYSEFSDMLKDAKKNQLDYDYENDSIFVNGSMKLDADLPDELFSDQEEKELLENLLKLTVGYSAGVDPKSENVELGLSLSEENKEILAADLFIKNNILYVNSQKLYDKSIEVIDLEEYINEISNELQAELGTDELTFNELLDQLLEEEQIDQEVYDLLKDFKVPKSVNYDDVDEVAKIIKDAINDSLIKEQFSKSKETIEINGKDVKVNKNTYTIDEKTADTMAEKVIDTLLENKKFITKVSSITGFSEDAVESLLKEMKSNADFEGMEEFQINIYTRGVANTIVGVSIEYDGDEPFIYTEDGDWSRIFMGDKDNYIEMVTEDETTTFKYISLEETLLEGTITIKDETTTIYVTTDQLGGKAEATIELYSKTESSKKRIDKVKVSVSLEGDYDLEASIALENTLEIGKDIADFNTNNSVKLENLTEDDMMNILTNLQNTVTGTVVEDIFNFIFQVNVVEPSSYCSVAYDCDCYDASCYCYYLDDEGFEQFIECPNPDYDVYSYY